MQNKSSVFEDRLFSKRTVKPTVLPTWHPRSDATRSASPMADIRLGWVTMMLQGLPLGMLSIMN